MEEPARRRRVLKREVALLLIHSARVCRWVRALGRVDG